MGPRIRDYRPPDFDKLWAIDQACFDPQIAYSRAELKFYIALPGAFTLVAEDERGEPVGFVVAHKQRGGIGHIVTIDIAESGRRKRLGSVLMQHAEERLHQQGCSAVTLETAVNNCPAIHFYKRLGYSIMRTLRGYYSNGLDALLMRKPLARTARSRPE
jgi:ribosomal-protein-alanine N-acetyltransferase